MKEGVVKYSEEIVNSVGLKKWRGIELPFDMENDDPLDVFARAESIVIRSQANMKEVQVDSVSIPVIQVQKEEKAIGLYVEDIMSCKNLKVLESYAPLIKGNDKMEDAYELRRKQLTSAPF
jgi:hypothetical protein